MTDGLRRIAMVSMHTSPADRPGSGDAGGMNVAILSLATELARRGVEVDLLSRATAKPGERQLAEGVVASKPRGGTADPPAQGAPRGCRRRVRRGRRHPGRPLRAPGTTFCTPITG
ncbi:MAG: hypothetical protein WDM88_12505 [Galbitalea sp.]